jgi:hypothetical protein
MTQTTRCWERRRLACRTSNAKKEFSLQISILHLPTHAGGTPALPATSGFLLHKSFKFKSEKALYLDY